MLDGVLDRMRRAYHDVVYDARIDREAASVAARRHTAAQRVRLEVLYLPYTACLGLRGSCEARQRPGGDVERACEGHACKIAC